MKYIIISFFLSFNLLVLKCQVFIDEYGEKCFNKAIELFNLGDYRGADSLYTVALSYFSNENIYINRGITRLYLEDTMGFCHDFHIASNKYMDKEASVMFNNICCYRVDTLSYTKKFKPSSYKYARYYEVIKFLKYDSSILGFYHDKKYLHEINTFQIFPYFQKGDLFNFHNIISRKSDIFAAYEVINDTKFYLIPQTKPHLKKKNFVALLKRKWEDVLGEKYADLKKQSNFEKISVLYKILINNEGEAIRVDLIDFDSEFQGDNKLLFDLQEDFTKIVEEYPNFRPAKFNRENVSSVYYDFLTF